MRTDFLQTLPNGNKVFDFHKIDEDKVPINIIITERGAKGKTFNSKEFALDKFKESGKKTIWLMNTKEQVENDRNKFLTNNRLVNSNKWEDVELQNWNVKHKGETFLEFVSLSTSENKKGSRDMNVKYVIYDEFNVGLTQIRNKQVSLLNGLLATYNDIQNNDAEKVRLFIFGNNKSLYTPLLLALKIFVIDEEVMLFRDSLGKPLIRIICLKPNKDDVEEAYKYDWTYQLAKLTGEDEHIFLNESLYDSINGIEQININEYEQTSMTYYIENRYYGIYRHIINGKYHVKSEDKPKTTQLIVLDKKEANLGLAVRTKVKELFLLPQLEKNNISFDSVATKATILSIF